MHTSTTAHGNNDNRKLLFIFNWCVGGTGFDVRGIITCSLKFSILGSQKKNITRARQVEGKMYPKNDYTHIVANGV